MLCLDNSVWMCELFLNNRVWLLGLSLDMNVHVNSESCSVWMHILFSLDDEVKHGFKYLCSLLDWLNCGCLSTVTVVKCKCILQLGNMNVS